MTFSQPHLIFSSTAIYSFMVIPYHKQCPSKHACLSSQWAGVGELWGCVGAEQTYIYPTWGSSGCVGVKKGYIFQITFTFLKSNM